MRNILEVRELSKVFRLHVLNGKTIEALRDVSLEIAEAEILGLTGHSGSGKSTLMKCIHRTYLPGSGEVWLRRPGAQAIDLASCDEHAVLQVRRTSMTYCSQFLQVIPRVGAADVVAAELVRRGKSREMAHTAACKPLERLALPRELWDAFPATFSGGEQQRVNIARAVIERPFLLLLDEPTASLDAAAKGAVIDLMLELRSLGTSIILISHDGVTRSRLADREVHLAQGRIADAGIQMFTGHSQE